MTLEPPPERPAVPPGESSTPVTLATANQEFLRFFKQVAKAYIAAIRRFIDGWNDRCHSFTWIKTADDILDHFERLCRCTTWRMNDA